MKTISIETEDRPVKKWLPKRKNSRDVIYLTQNGRPTIAIVPLDEGDQEVLAIRKNKSHLGMEDYRFAGGAQGVLTAYISDRLERFGSVEREGVLKALLALANLETNQRIAEGKTVDELGAAAKLPAQRLGL